LSSNDDNSRSPSVATPHLFSTTAPPPANGRNRGSRNSHGQKTDRREDAACSCHTGGLPTLQKPAQPAQDVEYARTDRSFLWAGTPKKPAQHLPNLPRSPAGQQRRGWWRFGSTIAAESQR